MHKLKLHLDDLRVESFDTTTVRKEKGTVFGEQCTCPSACTCPGCPSCDATCPATCPYTCDDASCGASCGGTCDGSCDGGYTCAGCTWEPVATCFNYGTCDPGQICREVP
jgi:hypothetical protein